MTKGSMAGASGARPRVLLRRIRETLARAGDREERLNRIVELIATNMVAEVCSIYLLDVDKKLELLATEGLKRDAIRRARLAISEGSQRLLKFVAGTFTTIGLGEVFMHGGPTPDDTRSFADNRLTSDLDRFMRNTGFVREHPELGVGGPTAAWLFAAFRAMDRVDDPEFHGQITIPTLMICAGGDQVVSCAAIEDLGGRLRSGSCLTIDGAKHEILQERNTYREQLLSAFGSFVPGTELV